MKVASADSERFSLSQNLFGSHLASRFGLALLFLLGMAFLYYGTNRKTYARLITVLIDGSLPEGSIRFNLIEPDLDGFTLIGERLEVFNNFLPDLMEATEPRLTINPFSLLNGQIEGDLALDMYRGKVRSSVYYHSGEQDKEALKLNLTGWNLQVGDHPLAKLVGLFSGKLKIELANLTYQDEKVKSGNIKVEVKNLNRKPVDLNKLENTLLVTSQVNSQRNPEDGQEPKIEKLKLLRSKTYRSIVQTNQVLNTFMPTISGLSLTTHIQVESENIEVINFRLDSHIGELRVEGTIVPLSLKNPFGEVDLSINGALTKSGKRKFGQLISSFAGTKSSKITGQLTGPLIKPFWQIDKPDREAPK